MVYISTPVQHYSISSTIVVKQKMDYNLYKKRCPCHWQTHSSAHNQRPCKTWMWHYHFSNHWRWRVDSLCQWLSPHLPFASSSLKLFLPLHLANHKEEDNQTKKKNHPLWSIRLMMQCFKLVLVTIPNQCEHYGNVARVGQCPCHYQWQWIHLPQLAWMVVLWGYVHRFLSMDLLFTGITVCMPHHVCVSLCRYHRPTLVDTKRGQ